MGKRGISVSHSAVERDRNREREREREIIDVGGWESY
jgi:hypothetical protein